MRAPVNGGVEDRTSFRLKALTNQGNLPTLTALRKVSGVLALHSQMPKEFCEHTSVLSPMPGLLKE